MFSSKVWGYWGNYKIFNDTITIETIGSRGQSFRHSRHVQMGVIKQDSICFFLEIDRDGKASKYNETIRFEHTEIKPDSTQNWIRMKRKYNRNSN